MATITAAAGGGNWTVGATWVGGSAPTAADDARLDATSGNVTIDAGAVCRSLDCTGYTGTLTMGASVVFNIGDGTAGAGNVALKFVAGMTYTRTSAETIQFVSTSATQQTVTTAGKTLGTTQFSGVGSSYILGDGLTTISAATVILTAGTFNTGNFACSWGLFVSSGSSTRTLTLGSSAITMTGSGTGVVQTAGTGLSITANTATMTMTGTVGGFLSASSWGGMNLVYATSCLDARLRGTPTLNNVSYVGPALKDRFFIVDSAPTITGTFTLTGNSTVNRLILQSDIPGTPRTVTAAAVSFTNVDFSDITAAGAAIPWTGTSMGNALGNSNITFDAPVTQTRTGAGGNWSTAANWTSRVPLPQDNVVVGAGASGTITADMPRLGADIDFTGFTGTASFASVANTVFGSLTLASGMTISGAQTLTLAARSAKTITSGGKAVTMNTLMVAPGGTYTLQDAFATSGLLNVSFGVGAGTLNTNNQSLSAWGFYTYNGGPSRAVTLGTSVITATATSGNVFDFAGSATFSMASATFVLSAASASARTFAGSGQAFGTLTYTVAGSTGSLTIVGSNTFGTINFSDPTNARSLLFTAGTTTTITGFFNVVGTAGKLMTVDSATAATHALTTGSTISTDYLNIANSQAAGGPWYAGANSVNGGGNTGWIFTAPPAVGAGRRALSGVGV